MKLKNIKIFLLIAQFLKLKASSKFWEKLDREVSSFMVYDPDGWDWRGDFLKDWYKRITYDEFLRKKHMSSCLPCGEREQDK